MNNNTYYSFILMAYSVKSKDLAIEYFDKFPL